MVLPCCEQFKEVQLFVLLKIEKSVLSSLLEPAYCRIREECCQWSELGGGGGYLGKCFPKGMSGSKGKWGQEVMGFGFLCLFV